MFVKIQGQSKLHQIDSFKGYFYLPESVDHNPSNIQSFYTIRLLFYSFLAAKNLAFFAMVWLVFLEWPRMAQWPHGS